MYVYLALHGPKIIIVRSHIHLLKLCFEGFGAGVQDYLDRLLLLKDLGRPTRSK